MILFCGTWTLLVLKPAGFMILKTNTYSCQFWFFNVLQGVSYGELLF